VIKIGSNVLTRQDGTLDVTRVSSLVDQIAVLHKAGIEVMMVSSGAVAAGRSELAISKKLDEVSARQIFSSIGQVKLINMYYNFFREYNIACGQVLTTKESFSTRAHYLNQRHCMTAMLENHIIPIINENDTISVTELMFTDNDELSGLISTMMGAQVLIILSNVDGIYCGNPGDEGVEVLKEVNASNADLTPYIHSAKSQFGRGGMLTKSRISKKVADQGVEVIIANGKKDTILVDLLLKDEDIVCTRFVPSKKLVSGVKKWIAHSDSFAKGKVYINEGAYEALTHKVGVSLLSIGVVALAGEFDKDDIVIIVAPSGKHIGLGRVAYNNEEAAQILGSKGKKPIIHYDYLYIEDC